MHLETATFLDSGSSGFLEKQQQSFVNTSEDKIQLQKRKESFEKTKSGLQFLDDRRAEHSFETLIFKYVYLDTMMKAKEKKWENMKKPHSQYWEWEVDKIPKSTGRRIHV